MADPAAAARPAQSLAVVGLACRFPDADDAPELLDVVLTGRRAFRRIPPVRLDLTEYYQADPATSDATYSTRAALIEGWRFDCAAFGIDPAAYTSADPALWLALETTARALAGAGLTGGAGLNRDRTGVIIGNTLGGDVSRASALRVRWPYVRRVLTDALTPDVPASQAGAVLRRAERHYLGPFPAMGPDSLAGSTPGAIATAICGYFGFRGGGHAVDSACSSSLHAVAQACTALAAGELDAAIAGGVDVSIDPLELIGLAKAGVLATGSVRIYDQEPAGYLPAEGCGVVVLMRASDARAAGLPVYAEIAGWGVSGGGPGLPEEGPGASSQLLAMQRAYEQSGLEPAQVQFFEGNGAATREDDDIELAALGALRRGARQPAALGSVKANIGHAKAAAGAAGLIKTVLALSNGVVPPATGVHKPHPMITDGDAQITLPHAAREWPEGTRLAAVSTLSSGGTSVHLVLRSEPAAMKRRERLARSLHLPVQSLDGDGVQPRLMPDLSEPVPFLVHASDRVALASFLSRIAAVARWLSDAELQDLACSLARQPGPQGKARVALVAAGQEELAARAAEAAAMLPAMTEGLLTVRPGIYASHHADGRTTLLLSGEASAVGPGGQADPLTETVSQCLDTLRWLDTLDVQAACAVGHGIGALAGLAWAGVLGESEVVEIARLRSQFLNGSSPAGPSAAGEQGSTDSKDGDGDGDDPSRVAGANGGRRARAAAGDRRVHATALRAAIAQKYRFGPARRRLISTVTGTEITSVDDAIDLICTGFVGADRMTGAISDGAVGATVMLETGPGDALTVLATQMTRVPAVSLGSGYGDPASCAEAGAALFAAGALGQPQPLFAGWSFRPIDIWRERAFIASPCEMRAPAGPAGQTISPPAGQPASAAAAVRQPPVFESPVVEWPVPAPVPPQPAGLAPWTRCFGERLHPADPPAAEDGLAWRLHVADGPARLASAEAVFTADPQAPRTMAVIADPADADSCAVALQAARDAIATGQLVVATTSPGFTGFFAGLQAEHPHLGVTLLRLPDADDCLKLAARYATATPGRIRELVIGQDGTASEPAMSELALEGGRAFPLGPEDVVLVSRGARGAGLALAQVLACCGTAVAVIGRPADDDSELVAGLEQLRSAGARVGYEVVDLTNPAGVSAAVQRLEGRLGPVTAIGHAAGPGDPVPLADLSDIEIIDHVTSETSVLDLLAGSVRAGQLRLIVTFGSVAGRYGMASGTMLALAGGALAARAAQLATAAGSCRSLHVDVPAWTAAGLGERAEVTSQLAAAGTTAIDVSVAARLLLKIMTTPGLPDRLAVHGRVGGPAATAPATAATAALRQAGPSATELAAAGLPGGGRFLRDVLVYYPGIELICGPRLSLRTDPYLADYQVDGLLVLPPALALEALAQAAAVLAGRPVRAAANVRLESPVVVPAGGEAELRICAQREGTAITVALRCAESSFAVDHALAEFDCTPAGEEASSTGQAPSTGQAASAGQAASPRQAPAAARLPASLPGLVDGAELYGPVCFQSGRFRRIALLPEVTARSCSALARGTDDQPWFEPGSELAGTGFLLGSPGLADASLQLLQACVPQHRLWPAGCAAVTFSGRAASGPVEIRASATVITGAVPAQAPRPGAEVGQQAGPATGTATPDQLWDIDAVDSDGSLLISWRGVRVRETGPLPRHASWPPPLLAVYLERGTHDLGLDPTVRITAECGHPAGPVPRLATAVPRQATAQKPRAGANAGDQADAPGASAGQPPARHTAIATGSGALEGFSLTVTAGVPVACAWTTVEPGQRHGQPPAAMAPAYARLRRQLGEPPNTLAARLRAIGSCLTGTGMSAENVSCSQVTAEGWALMQAGQATIASAVVQVSGVPDPVAVAIMTAEPKSGPRRPARQPAAAAVVAVAAEPD